MNSSDAGNAQWHNSRGELADFIHQEVCNQLEAYKAVPRSVLEQANIEHDAAYGGYAGRQLFELVQNSVDSLFDSAGERIHICLNRNFLYCADDGTPIDKEGIEALISSHLGNKRGKSGMIGRFGLGFKSVLGVSDSPEFYSRSVSFRFDRKKAEELIRTAAPDAARYPVLRTPEPIDPDERKRQDKQLGQLMGWATNIVRLPLKEDNKGEHFKSLSRQIWKFPPEFLLVVDHVRWLHMKEEGKDREFELRKDGDEIKITDSGEGYSVEDKIYPAGSKESISRWKLFSKRHRLSDAARANYEGKEVEIRWAARLGRPEPDKDRFWAFFPTSTASLVPGVLNAHWKTNEDRQNLLLGAYNDELIGVAAQLIADCLPELAADTDPARHLDMLPRNQVAGDSEQSIKLRKRLFDSLKGRAIVPDQDGSLRTPNEVSYPPRFVTDGSYHEALKHWASCPGRPSDWLHHRAFTRRRMAVIDWLAGGSVERATFAEWLEKLVHGKQGDDLVQASMAAIKVAAELQPEEGLGSIVLTAAGELLPPCHESLVLPPRGEAPDSGGDGSRETASVHPKLVEDKDTFDALEKLGVRPPSPASSFRSIYARIQKPGGSQDSLWEDFYIAYRRLPEPRHKEAAKIIAEIHPTHNAGAIRVRTQAGTWAFPHCVLLPGEIVPGDESQDDEVTVDTHFHAPDCELLQMFGVVQSPRDCYTHIIKDNDHSNFERECKSMYTRKVLKDPRWEKLVFDTRRINKVGPLSVLAQLSDEGKAFYTDALLKIDAVFEDWLMHHATIDHYPKIPFKSFAMYMLRKHGRIRASTGIVALKDALGKQPVSREALHSLLKHPNAAKIKEAFELAEPVPEFVGEGEPTSLIDIWPGLEDYLPDHLRECCLVRCERIEVAGEAEECAYRAPNVYLAYAVEDDRQLSLVADRLRLDLKHGDIRAILNHTTPKDVEKRRAAIRACPSDADRLLEAVGKEKLSDELPESLLKVLRHEGGELSGTEIAEAAIATWHTGALIKHKSALAQLNPPKQWAGSVRAVEFVKSLGFSEAWAGQPKEKYPSFLEVEGPYSPLPDLHYYQKTVAKNIKQVLCGDNGTARRGLVSMPTGSGKTRVAVQSVVEAMCEGQLQGGVLWVADRYELCEQAVVAWRQVWARVGRKEETLRISRMWDNPDKPQPTSRMHVIVATIQTLKSRIEKKSGEYEFLKEFELVVFDEAHRSVAPTFTSVMKEIGLTRYEGQDEPFLLGLTATPYRGRDKKETKRLASRYGNRRLDEGAFKNDEPEQVIRELQTEGILAYTDHGTIEGKEYSISPEERERMRAPGGDGYLPWLPEATEKRIACDPDRTRRIIEAYERYIRPDWSTLVFATSVEHAQTVAALLNRKKIQARSVSGKTDTTVRRRVVEEFRRGEIRALVNYGVFSEGFDAPKTRAIIVARPVYSPNLYFQMIGRGLRGRENGGDDQCLILNVRDNIKNFEGKLAFTELDSLWRRGSKFDLAS